LPRWHLRVVLNGVGLAKKKDRGQTEGEKMNTKNVIIVLVLLIISIGLTNARADVIKNGITEAKYDIKEFKEETGPQVLADVKALPGKGKDFWNKEVEKTKEFQKQGWEDAKKQTAPIVNGIKKFFTGLKKEAVK